MIYGIVLEIFNILEDEVISVGSSRVTLSFGG
jgi:hypothetical protein